MMRAAQARGAPCNVRGYGKIDGFVVGYGREEKWQPTSSMLGTAELATPGPFPFPLEYNSLSRGTGWVRIRRHMRPASQKVWRLLKELFLGVDCVILISKSYTQIGGTVN